MRYLRHIGCVRGFGGNAKGLYGEDFGAGCSRKGVSEGKKRGGEGK